MTQNKFESRLNEIIFQICLLVIFGCLIEAGDNKNVRRTYEDSSNESDVSPEDSKPNSQYGLGLNQSYRNSRFGSYERTDEYKGTPELSDRHFESTITRDYMMPGDSSRNRWRESSPSGHQPGDSSRNRWRESSPSGHQPGDSSRNRWKESSPSGHQPGDRYWQSSGSESTAAGRNPIPWPRNSWDSQRDESHSNAQNGILIANNDIQAEHVRIGKGNRAGGKITGRVTGNRVIRQTMTELKEKE